MTLSAMLTALALVLAPQTALAAISTDGTGASQIQLQNAFALVQGTFPAANLWAEPLKTLPRSASTYTPSVVIHVDYYARWDEDVATLDAQWARIAADLAIMRANIERNRSCIVTATPYIESLLRITLSPYYGKINRSFSGLTVLVRTLSLTIVLPEYDA